jgi:flagellar motor switch protein FliM
MASSLSQSEIDALLSGLETGVSRPVLTEATTAGPSADLPYAELVRKLAATLCTHLTAELEHSLRGRCEVRLAGFSSSICAEVLASLDARCVAVVESRQVGSHSLVAMNSGAVFPMIDCLLGGGSSTVAAAIPERPLTDIELKLISRCLNSIVAALQQAWSQFQPAEFQVAHIEGRIPAAELISPREPVVTLQLEMAVNGLLGQSTLVIPERAILDLAKKSGLATTPSDATPLDATGTAGESQPHAEIRVQLTSLDVNAETLGSLNVGDILPLKADSSLSKATIFVDGSPAFTGTPGIHAGRKAVRIEAVTEAEKPSRPTEKSGTAKK